jgi:hypothetical protein
LGNCDVDAPELLAGSPHGLLDGIDMGDIAFQRQTFAAWERRRNLPRCRQINVGQHDSCPALSQYSGGGRTQSATGTILSESE